MQTEVIVWPSVEDSPYVSWEVNVPTVLDDNDLDCAETDKSNGKMKPIRGNVVLNSSKAVQAALKQAKMRKSCGTSQRSSATPPDESMPAGRVLRHIPAIWTKKLRLWSLAKPNLSRFGQC